MAMFTTNPVAVSAIHPKWRRQAASAVLGGRGQLVSTNHGVLPQTCLNMACAKVHAACMVAGGLYNQPSFGSTGPFLILYCKRLVATTGLQQAMLDVMREIRVLCMPPVCHSTTHVLHEFVAVACDPAACTP